MRILVASSSSPDRGAGISSYARDITEELIARGHTVYFLSPSPASSDWFHELGITHLVSDWATRQDKQAVSLLRSIKEEKIEGVVNNDNSLLQSVLPALKVPSIVVGHLADHSVGRLCGYNLEYVDYLVAISADMQRRFQDVYKLEPWKVPLIYNGVRSPPQADSVATGTGDILRVVIGSGYSRRKGGDLVVRALALMESSSKPVVVDWFGDVPREVKDRLARLPFIRFPGRVPRDRFRQSLQQSDVLFFSSRREGCPMLVLEAMSYGVVPIVSDGEGAMRWIVRNGKDGFVCRLENWSKEAVSCLQFLDSNRSIMEKMARSSASRIYRSFNIASTVDGLEGLLGNPCVDRSFPRTSLSVLRPTRFLRPGGVKRLLDRLSYRFGLLRVESDIDLAGSVARQ